jgi:hypothetical protein
MSGDGLRIGEVTLTNPVYKTAVVIPVSVEAFESGRIVAHAIDDQFDRFLHPWKYPDRPRWPETFVLAPRLAAFNARMRERRQRVRDAWSVLRGWDRIATDDDC